MELPAEIGALGEVKCLLCLAQVGHDVPIEHPGRESKDSWIYSFEFRRVSGLGFRNVQVGVGGVAQGEVLKVTNQKKEQPKEEGGKPDLEARGIPTCCDGGCKSVKAADCPLESGKRLLGGGCFWDMVWTA